MPRRIRLIHEIHERTYEEVDEPEVETDEPEDAEYEDNPKITVTEQAVAEPVEVEDDDGDEDTEEDEDTEDDEDE